MNATTHCDETHWNLLWDESLTYLAAWRMSRHAYVNHLAQLARREFRN